MAPKRASKPPVLAPDGESIFSNVEPLKGEVCVQYIRCNKAQCQCHSTDKRHGPYYYRVWREGSRVRKQYVRAQDVDRVRAACAAYHALNQRLKELRQQRERLTSHLRGEWRKSQHQHRQWVKRGTL